MNRDEIGARWEPTRLALLRERLAEVGVDGLIITRWDAHQSEYVLPRDERLAWATGFTGTWGLAVILPERAALFVDGRYSVQAERETDPAAFEIRHLYDDPPQDWIQRSSAKGTKIGFDEMTLSPASHAAMAAAALERGACLHPLSEDPVGAVWTDRPREGPGPVSAFPVDLAGETSRSKRGRLADRLSALGIDLLLETQTDNIAWLLNIRGDDLTYLPAPQAFAIVDAEGGLELFVDRERLLDDDALEMAGVDIHGPGELLGRLRSRAANGARVSIDPRFAPIGGVLATTEGGGTPVVAANPLTALKAKKNAVELAGMRAACGRDAIAWVRFLSWLDVAVRRRATGEAPVTEIEAEEAILQRRRQLDRFVGPSFRSISAAGANAALCHYAAPAGGGSSLTLNDLYLLDSGGQYSDGTTDLTRTVAFSAPGEEMQRIFTLVLKGHIALAAQRFPPGTRGYQLDAFARSALWNAGLDYDHGTGHGVGHFLSVHEQPQRIGKEPLAVALEPGMIMTIEPGHYVPDRYGIRIEDMYEIVADASGWMRFEPITCVPICRKLIETRMLDRRETAWIDSYHARTRQALASAPLDAGETAWLHAATEPLGAGRNRLATLHLSSGPRPT